MNLRRPVPFLALALLVPFGCGDDPTGPSDVVTVDGITVRGRTEPLFGGLRTTVSLRAVGEIVTLQLEYCGPQLRLHDAAARRGPAVFEAPSTPCEVPDLVEGIELGGEVLLRRDLTSAEIGGRLDEGRYYVTAIVVVNGQEVAVDAGSILYRGAA